MMRFYLIASCSSENQSPGRGREGSRGEVQASKTERTVLKPPGMLGNFEALSSHNFWRNVAIFKSVAGARRGVTGPRGLRRSAAKRRVGDAPYGLGPSRSGTGGATGLRRGGAPHGPP